MNKKLLFLSFLSLASIASSAYGFINFSFGGGAPSVGLGVNIPLEDGGPSVGFGVNIPLCEPRPVVYRPMPVVVPVRVIYAPKRDRDGFTYWKITNATTEPIMAQNSLGKRILINPGHTAKLSHRDGFELTVSIEGEDFEEFKTVEKTSHNLTVQYTPKGLKITGE